MTPQHVVWICDCGLSLNAQLAHYGLARCRCGRNWWALQPKRNGPLEAFPWPGNHQTKRAQEKAQAWQAGGIANG